MPHPWEAKWTVGNRLGVGGQGVTYEATFSQDSTIRGALKHLKNNRSLQARARMRREVASLQTLANLGGAVPRVLDHNTDEFEDTATELFVVMDLIPGSTLHTYIEKHGPLGIDKAVGVVMSICKTMKIAHSFPILHRDLKPENILVRNDNPDDMVIVDYGLSFNVADEQITKTSDTFRNSFLDLPETNTPSGDRRDLRSDVTAVCAVLYFCLTKHVVGQLQDGTGTLPHFRSGYSIRKAVTNDERVENLEAILTRGFSANINNRFQNIDELTLELASLVARPSHIDESDPIQVAAALSRNLRAKDRKTQLAEFRLTANELIVFLQHEVFKYQQNLGRFKVDLSGGGFRRKPKMPEGIDLVFIWTNLLTVQAAYHPQQENRQYLVGSRGEQCVLLAGDYQTNAEYPGTDAEANLEVKEIAWYEVDPKPIFQLAAMTLRNWVISAMNKIAQQILPSSPNP